MAAHKRAKNTTTGAAAGAGAPVAFPSPTAGEPTEVVPTLAADVAAAGELPAAGCPVAGLVASAGGLDAFRKFFTTMPADSGVAFVLVPHLDPNHDSLMVELLARCTKMPVVEATDGMAVAANQLFLLPPNKYMTISNGVLNLTGPVERGLQTSIDVFLRSLANDKREKAICIVLSGTGSHGSLGLKAIKAANGMAMVQDPTTAEYPRMPENAIATGLADYVLPAEQMPAALVKYLRHYLSPARSAGAGTDASDELGEVIAVLRTRTNFDFGCYRKAMLHRRVERRMSLGHFNRIADYVAFLREEPAEGTHLFRDLLISVTNFFRDPEAFADLESPSDCSPDSRESSGRTAPHLVRRLCDRRGTLFAGHDGARAVGGSRCELPGADLRHGRG